MSVHQSRHSKKAGKSSSGMQSVITLFFNLFGYDWGYLNKEISYSNFYA